MHLAPSTLRQSTSTSSRVLKRHSSSTAKIPPAPHALSPQKMRALISLYHQSDTFITPENLSERIDQAFTKDNSAQLATSVHQPSSFNLRAFYLQTKRAPKFNEWDHHKVRFGHGPWSKATYSPREWKVIEALYGVDASGELQPLPGLEALEEGDGESIGLPPAELDISGDGETHIENASFSNDKKL